MKILINKDFAGWKSGDIVEVDEHNKALYGDVAYWLRRCEDGKIDGYCELIEFLGKKIKKDKSVVQSNKK